MLLLKAYNAMYISTILYVCLKLILVRADHPNNVTRGGVCIYYKKSLPVRVINLPDLQEALLLELNDQNKKKIIISSLYRSPSQNSEKFESFLTNFDISYLISTLSY